MNRAEAILVMFILGCIFGACMRILDTIEEHACSEEQAILRPAPVHLPTKCAEFYNDDTDAWIDCMGVGYVYRRDL